MSKSELKRIATMKGEPYPSEQSDPDVETTMCWRCNKVHPITDLRCPRCNSTNSNVDFEQAAKEMIGG